MTDRKTDEPRNGSRGGGAPPREGLGDDQGTRVGSPAGGGKEAAGPSSRTAPEGLEGSIMEGSEDAVEDRGSRSTGAGAEAARGAHAFGSGREGTPERIDEATPNDENLPDAENPGSEPLRGTHRQHVSGYGGSADKPKTSSDQREPLDYEGSGGEHGR